MYVFENIDTIDTDWTISKFQKAWKEYKHELFKKYVKDQPPSFVREHPKQGIPLQDWRQFVDNCNSRNSRKLLATKTLRVLGGNLQFVAKVEMTKEKGVPVSSITRLDQYMHNHKRKNGEHQDPELVEKLNDYTALHLESRETSVNDALTKVLGPDSRGCFRGLGEGVCKTSVKKMKVVAQQNLALKEMNTDLVKREIGRGELQSSCERVVYDGGVFVLPLPHDDWRSKFGEVAKGVLSAQRTANVVIIGSPS
ncbi:hypothetical protein IFM89_015258 [Coptis chinensis]|uniref:Transposase n=1 Tax=Coptis chinensis TaxID=261450 RepID=A0A835LLN1_9MAGN|nr:hypothetical protein IFM89_015258 [Coptis chinensis]